MVKRGNLLGLKRSNHPKEKNQRPRPSRVDGSDFVNVTRVSGTDKGEEGKSRHFTFRFISKELIVVKDSLRYHLKVLFITIIFHFPRFLNVNPF